MEQLVKSKPYPEYNTMNDLLLNDSASFLGHGFFWAAEYSVANHNRCKRMYESFLDKEVCKKEGSLINKDGGIDAMRACFYIMLHFTKSQLIKELEVHWDGVGLWRA